MSRLRLSLVAGVAVGALCAACGRAPSSRAFASSDGPTASADGFPLRVRDDRGKTVLVPKEPKRIVALLPSYTELLFALGVGDRVVGIDDFSEYPPEANLLPRLGGLYDTHLEAVLSLRPDLVLISDPNGAAAALEQNGIAVWAGDAPKFEDVFRVMKLVGALVGKPTEARRLSERIRAEIAALEGRLRGSPRVRVYYEIDPTPYAAGPTSFLGEMLAKAGGDNVVPGGLGDFPKISPEAVIAGDPEVIVGASLAEVAARPGWGAIAAVRNGRVYKLSPAESHVVVCPGPRIAAGLEVVARHLHPGVHL
ncbi:MAG: ABC transporter substrate-binding protein [Myxococcota bacterium]|nr:ABC transporter substrate-binding protein [Myxococcota bacterium]